jgi:hypothetical protein
MGIRRELCWVESGYRDAGSFQLKRALDRARRLFAGGGGQWFLCGGRTLFHGNGISRTLLRGGRSPPRGDVWRLGGQCVGLEVRTLLRFFHLVYPTVYIVEGHSGRVGWMLGYEVW